LRASENLLGFFSVARGHLIKCKKLTSLSKNVCGGTHFIKSSLTYHFHFNPLYLKVGEETLPYSSLGRGGSYNRAHL